ncbi:MAG TPA: adenosylmethionine--8-amino-7-oxononanoate transaminase [Candidatus Dormibacteraeota bacterium]|nr:adenosylmethionine--8-amino-7-oxononanoate transaminase [Candidatus Dormibacteraeota bacterium]
MRNWVERDARRVWHGFTQMAAYSNTEPLVVDRAEGRYLIDIDGRRYLDAISSLWVNTLGHRVPELDQALIEQTAKVAHSTMLGNGNTAVIELAEALAPLVPVDDPHFLFASDGASAVEQALKIAFQYWINHGRSERRRFLALGGAYHGDTTGALSAGDGGFGTDIFAPLEFPVLRTPGLADPNWADLTIEAIESHSAELAAVIVEPLVQGAGGILIGKASDFRRVAQACQRFEILLICDEVATGFGRTGALFASDLCEIRPDLLCLGKGLTGGYLPMSATVASDRVYSAFLGRDLGPQTLYHGHSYGGNALAAAVAKRHLELITQPAILANVEARSSQLGQLLEAQIAGSESVRSIRIQGLMAGVELIGGDQGGLARRVCAESVRRGVLLRPLGEVIVIMPPLTINAAEIKLIVEVLEAALAHVTGLIAL